ncbi:MAG: PadR family transcriptional regulator [Candidatus Nanohaloarchaea archaeon]
MSDIDLSNVNRLYTVLLLESSDRYGYEIMDRIEEVTGNRPSSSHIYPFLSKMQEEGYVNENEDGRKKVYSLTEKGEKFASEQLESFGEILQAAIEGEVKECSHCDCKIYDDGYEEDGEIYCCKHCARAV